MKHIAVLGAGAWGTAVATLLAHNGHRVRLWCVDPLDAECITARRVNEKYLPGVTLSPLIEAVTDLRYAVCKAQWVFEAIPVKFLRSVLQQARICFQKEQVWVVLSKGIEQQTLLLPSQIIDDVFGYQSHKAVFAGPSFARDLAYKKITAVSIAASDAVYAYQLQKLLANEYFRPYLSHDLIGTQVGGAAKNIITILIGMLDGAGYTDNTKAFVLTRGLQEIKKLTVALGGNAETVYGLSGVGDLVLTAMGKLSRNQEVGKRLGSGQNLESILQETGYIPEGINTVYSVVALAQNKNIEMPLCHGVHQILEGTITLKEMLKQLMSKPLEQELY